MLSVTSYLRTDLAWTKVSKSRIALLFTVTHTPVDSEIKGTQPEPAGWPENRQKLA